MLHHEVQDLAALSDGVDRDDVRVAERRSRARLALEALDHAFSHKQQRGRQHLDRDFAVERQIVREIHGRHAAMPELEQDLVLAECRLSQCIKLCVRRIGPAFRVGGRGRHRGRPGERHGDPRAAPRAEKRPGAEARAAARAGRSDGRRHRLTL